MERATARTLRNAAIAAAIGAIHLLLVLFGYCFNSPYSATRRPVAAEAAFVMIARVQGPLIASPTPAARRPVRRLPTDTKATAREVPQAATAQPETQSRAAIDWSRESQLAAQGAAARKSSSAPRAFGAPLTPSTIRCKPPKAEFNWNPEPKRAGFIGVLPYVRLGNRCIVGLGFFGCGVGKPPEANSQLLNRMNAGNPHRSSVPDIPDCVEQ